MRITNGDVDRVASPGLPASPSTTKTRAGAGAASASSGQADAVDKVEVSQTGETLSHVLSIDAKQRAEKVAHLTELFQSGRLEVDPEALSDAILDEAAKTYRQEG
jgi:anti-sigma28 factor (negative regulator of flagellin synthesis)